MVAYNASKYTSCPRFIYVSFVMYMLLVMYNSGRSVLVVIDIVHGWPYHDTHLVSNDTLDDAFYVNLHFRIDNKCSMIRIKKVTPLWELK